jgi:hypothetical protein
MESKVAPFENQNSKGARRQGLSPAPAARGRLSIPLHERLFRFQP